MANPTGIQGPRQKPFRDALRLELAAAEGKRHGLRHLAAKLVRRAESGDVYAIREIADRIDGKVAQAIIGGDEDDPAIAVSVIERRIVDSPNSNSAGVPTPAGTKPI